MKKSLTEVQIIKRNAVVQTVYNNSLFATDDHIVWYSNNRGKSWQEICRLPPTKKSLYYLIKDNILRTSFIRKLRRNIGIQDLLVLTSGNLLLFYDKIYHFNAYSKFATPVFDFFSQNIIPPLKSGIAYNSIYDVVYFGEYNCSKKKHSVKIIRGYNDGTSWEICFEFPIGKIKHIHSIIYDSFRQIYWITTGDSSSESSLYYSDDEFRTVKLFKGGDYKWRIVNLIPTSDSIIWGSDIGGNTPANLDNYIYKWNFKEDRLYKLQKIPNPAYFTSVSPNLMIISTTYEPHKISRIKLPEAQLWYSIDSETWKPLINCNFHRKSNFDFKKKSNKFGMIYLPNTFQNFLYFTPINTEGHFNIYQLNCFDLT